MELWKGDQKACDVIGVYQSDHRQVVMQMGQLAPVETIHFLDVLLSTVIAVGMGDQFTIREGDAVCPVSIHHVIPLEGGRCLARATIPKK